MSTTPSGYKESLQPEYSDSTKSDACRRIRSLVKEDSNDSENGRQLGSGYPSNRVGLVTCATRATKASSGQITRRRILVYLITTQ